ncbi:MAG TPA: AsmA family protein [Thermoanaerobaculia bacterium]|nr:AsmA family protein [Thermoanaerobaculia bacterium]
MRSPLRRAVRIAEVLSGLGLALALALPRLIPAERIRARALAAAEEALHRPVEAGDARLEIFSGLGAGLENLSVRNAPGWESPTLFSAERVSLKLAFWPLLARRIEIDRIVVDAPTVAVERNEKGESNIDDLARGTIPSAASNDEPAFSLRPRAFLVSRVDVRHGRVVFVDRLAAAGRAARVALDDVTGTVRDLGSAAPVRFDVAARFLADSGRNVSVRGLVARPPGGDLASARLRVLYSAKNLDLSRLAPWAGAASREAGSFTVDGTAEGVALGGLTLAGRAALAPSGASRLPPLEGDYAVTLDVPSDSLTIRRSSLRVGSLPLTAEGRVDALRGEPRLDLRVATPESVSIERILSLAGAAGRLPSALRASGRLRFEARVRGPASDVAARIEADGSSLGAEVAGRPVFAAASLHAAVASRGRTAASGRIAVPSGSLRGVPFDDLSADWHWNDGTLVVVPLLRVFGGRVGMRLEADLRRPGSDSRLAFEVAGIPLDRLASVAPSSAPGASPSAASLLGGTLSGWMSMTGRGLGTELFARTASGEGRITVSRAELRTVRVMPEIAKTLARVGRAAGLDVPDGIDTPRQFALQTGLRFGGGRVETPDLTLTSGDVVVHAGGSVAADRTLSYRGRVVLGPEAVRGFGRLGTYLADSRGAFEIPFHVAGPASSPQVSVDLDAMAIGRRLVSGRLRDVLPERARRIVDGILGHLEGTGISPLERFRALFSPRGN